ncbi:hypothetical protein B7P43_G04527 [Cryptotermes secundus]|uniref:Uncharacterized protein n=1 Tax=Cryptotermes secundus TaxID=105785 RepID=A0A2J7RJY6_9NEOP|nr:hypothetical protein B7P43_G04527 [Cryptotermes secundus]
MTGKGKMIGVGMGILNKPLFSERSSSSSLRAFAGLLSF